MSTDVTPASKATGIGKDLEHFRRVTSVLETTQGELEELESSEAFQVFQKQLNLLRKRLLNDR